MFHTCTFIGFTTSVYYTTADKSHVLIVLSASKPTVEAEGGTEREKKGREGRPKSGPDGQQLSKGLQGLIQKQQQPWLLEKFLTRCKLTDIKNQQNS